MRIKKVEPSIGILGKILNIFSNSNKDTYSCNYINNAIKDVYSTEERVIGTWIDGKPLYRKVTTGTVSKETGEVEIDTGITNYDRYWISEGYVYPASGTGVTIPLNCKWPTGSRVNTRMIAGAKIHMQVDHWQGEYYIVVHYTKTTDSGINN